MHFVDAVLPISEFLIRQLESRRYRGRYLKVPPLTDFNQFNIVAPPAPEKFFLYVGSAAYLGAIDFITRSFDKTVDSDYFLYMVVNGPADQMASVERVVKGMKRQGNVKIFSKLNYATLIEMYRQAKALLIPLTKNITDVARFPQKISEYLASQNPVITTRNGEIPYYFTDMDNALVAEDYIAEAFAEKMNIVIESPAIAEAIGKRGYATGKKCFDLHSYGRELKQLLVDLDSEQRK
jgi:glycosyltransferase involved in cell wall biosynthesis